MQKRAALMPGLERGIQGNFKPQTNVRAALFAAAQPTSPAG
jgi:hypothetical protein